jgi:long-chain acyl-CoA synthetase
LTGEVQKQFMDRFGVPIGQNYGSTEAGHVAGTSFRDIKMGNFKPGAVGRAYKNVELKIVDADGKEKPRGEAGEIVARSAGSMKGYLKKEGEPSTPGKDEIVKEGWVYTGDLGYIDDDGYLFIVGRERDIIKAGGFQVSPLELEDCLLKMPEIKEVAVVGVKDARMGELPKAFVVLREGAKLTEEDVINFSKENLAKYKMVRQVAFIDSLPKNDTGKVLKRLLV